MEEPRRRIGDWSGFGGAADVDNSPYDLCTYSLRGIIGELASEAGLEPGMFDTAALDGIQVRGFAVTNVYPAANAVLALAQIFLFDPSNYDGAVHFLPRGGDAVGTITEDDLIMTDEYGEENDGADQNKLTRADPISIPKVLTLVYYDVEGSLNTDAQRNERAGDWRAVGSTNLQTAVLMTADEAKRAVAVTHRIMAEEASGSVQIQVTDEFLFLTPADNIFTKLNGSVRRQRITRIENEPCQMTFTLVRDRQGAYRSQLQGYPPAPPTPPPNRVVGVTDVQALDIHILRDADDKLGVYIGISGQSPAWYGATLEMSSDGGVTYASQGDWQAHVPIGVLLSGVGTALPAYPDEAGVLDVVLANNEDELEAVTMEQLLNRANQAIVGNEVVQFRDVNETSEGHWELSYLLRGRYQTPAVEHHAGERFVLLDREALYFIPADLGYLGKTITIRATSFGDTVDNATIISFVFAGMSQREYRPAYVAATRNGTSLTVQWQGVGKLGSGAAVAMGAYFSGYNVHVTDGSKVVDVDTVQQSAVVDVTGFASPITVSVSQRNQFTGLGPAAEVKV